MPFAVKVASKALKNVPSVEKLLKNHIQFTFREINEALWPSKKKLGQFK